MGLTQIGIFIYFSIFYRCNFRPIPSTYVCTTIKYLVCFRDKLDGPGLMNASQQLLHQSITSSSSSTNTNELHEPVVNGGGVPSGMPGHPYMNGMLGGGGGGHSSNAPTLIGHHHQMDMAAFYGAAAQLGNADHAPGPPPLNMAGNSNGGGAGGINSSIDSTTGVMSEYAQVILEMMEFIINEFKL